jgi:hypothetical protein
MDVLPMVWRISTARIPSVECLPTAAAFYTDDASLVTMEWARR